MAGAPRPAPLTRSPSVLFADRGCGDEEAGGGNFGSGEGGQDGHGLAEWAYVARAMGRHGAMHGFDVVTCGFKHGRPLQWAGITSSAPAPPGRPCASPSPPAAPPVSAAASTATRPPPPAWRSPPTAASRAPPRGRPRGPAAPSSEGRAAARSCTALGRWGWRRRASPHGCPPPTACGRSASCMTHRDRTNAQLTRSRQGHPPLPLPALGVTPCTSRVGALPPPWRTP